MLTNEFKITAYNTTKALCEKSGTVSRNIKKRYLCVW